MNPSDITFKIDHSRIKEITIGDEFIFNNGKIVKFVRLTKDGENFVMVIKGEPDILSNRFVFDNKLNQKYYKSSFSYEISHKIPNIKEKINLI